MRLLLVHGYYQQQGGEDRIFDTESALLEERGHTVIRCTLRNDAIRGMGRAELFARSLWNPSVYLEVRRLIREQTPDLVQVHNPFPLVSPSVYQAAHDQGLPVIQTLNNFRAVCINGLLLRKGKICEDCIHRRIPWPGVFRRCYRGGLATSAVAALLSSRLRAEAGSRGCVDLFAIYGTPFVRDLWLRAGLPAAKLEHKPNVIHPDPGPGPGDGGFALFVGRLSEEKGLRTLLDAWEQLDGRLPLRIVGDGPMAREVARRAARLKAVAFVGPLPPEQVLGQMGAARVLVFPSIWYETFGRVGAEAFARGTPVIASRLGAMQDLVEHGRTGLLVRPGDPRDLAESLRWLLAHPTVEAAMRTAARACYLDRFAAAPVLHRLEAMYRRVLGAA